MVNPPARYEPDFPLPAMAYVPGITPRRGTSLEGESPARLFRLGADLFNHGFYWESHEAWEAVWHAEGRAGDRAILIRGLIHLAACGVKARQGSLHGTMAHAKKSWMLLKQVREDHGLASRRELEEQAGKVAETANRFLCLRQENVVIVFDFRIELSRG